MSPWYRTGLRRRSGFVWACVTAGIAALMILPAGGTAVGSPSARESLTQLKGAGPAAQPILPRGVTDYVPIALWNNQSRATPSPFQQEITVNSSYYAGYERANLQNVEFFRADGAVIPSWLESGAARNATDSIYWLNLSKGIGANSILRIYLGFRAHGSAMNGITVGEAPELTPHSYGSLDSGANVFPGYSGFASTSTPILVSKLSYPASGTTVTFGQGLNVNTSCTAAPCPGVMVSFHLPKAKSYIFDVDEAQENTGGTGWYSNEWAAATYLGVRLGGEGYWSGHATSSPSPGQSAVFGFVERFNASNFLRACTYWYNASFSTAANQSGDWSNFYATNVCGKGMGHIGRLYVESGSGFTFNVTFDWTRYRAFPPNGVMPAYSVSTLIL